jgi:hypothetical protein
VTDLTDRMRTCAAFLLGNASNIGWTYDGAVKHSIDLLIEASNVIDAIPQPLGEPMEIIPPIEIVPSVKKILDKARAKEAAKQAGTWIDPGGALPTTGLLPPHKRSPRVCPQCDSHVNKRVYREGNMLMLACPVCAATWEWKR